MASIQGFLRQAQYNVPPGYPNNKKSRKKNSKVPSELYKVPKLPPSDNPFSELGVSGNRSLAQQNRSIREFLAANKGKLSKGEHSKLVKLRKANHGKLFPKDEETGADLRSIERQSRSEAKSRYGSQWKDLMDTIGGTKNALSKLPSYYDQRFADLTNIGANQAAASQAIAARLQQDQAGIAAGGQQFQSVLDKEAKGNQQMAGTMAAAKNSDSGQRSVNNQTAANIEAVGKLSQGTFQGLAQNSRVEQQEKTTSFENSLKRLNRDKADLVSAINDYFVERKSGTLSDIAERQLKAAAEQAKQELARATLDATTAYRTSQLENQRVAQQSTDAYRRGMLAIRKEGNRIAASKSRGNKVMTARDNRVATKIMRVAMEAIKQERAYLRRNSKSQDLTKAQWGSIRKVAVDRIKEAGYTSNERIPINPNSPFLDAAISMVRENGKMDRNILRRLQQDFGYKIRGSGFNW